MATHYIVGCGAAARNAEGKFLMVRQMSGYWKGKWIFPGGKLEIGETLDQCARREFTEETCCDLTIKKQIGAYVCYDPDTTFEKQVVLVYYSGNGITGRPCIGEGVTDIAWFSLEDIETMAKAGKVPEIILKVAEESLK
jgi:8-oxo-dGTP diphosphatase